MKNKPVFIRCGLCEAEQDLTGVFIGNLEKMALPVHSMDKCQDPSDEHNTMLLAESLTDPNTCPASEQLVSVHRPEETQEEWAARHQKNGRSHSM